MMKKKIIGTLLLCIPLFLSSCGNENNVPIEIEMEPYIESTKSNDTNVSEPANESGVANITEPTEENSNTDVTESREESGNTEAAVEATEVSSPTEATLSLEDFSLDSQEDYVKAYANTIMEYEKEYEGITYDLIYVDDDEIPELVAGKTGYYVNLYTYAEGQLYTLMDFWGYGAMGNVGYEYLPKENTIRNFNTDYAGLVHYTSYCRINENYEMEWYCELKDAYLDEEGNIGHMNENSDEPGTGEWHSFYNGEEVTEEEYNSHRIEGEFEYILGEKSALEIMEQMCK